MSTERIISADSHVNPPKDLWVRDCASEAQGSRAARRVDRHGRLLDRRLARSRAPSASTPPPAASRRTSRPSGLTYKDMRPGSYDPKARLEDMDLDGVDAEVLYFGGPVTQYAERRRAAALHRAALQRLDARAVARRRRTAWSASRTSRWSTSTRACAELGRIAKLGLKGFHVDPFPDERGGKPLWDPAYEPFWSLIEETGLPMSFHIVGPRNANVQATCSRTRRRA